MATSFPVSKNDQKLEFILKLYDDDKMLRKHLLEVYSPSSTIIVYLAYVTTDWRMSM